MDVIRLFPIFTYKKTPLDSDYWWKNMELPGTYATFKLGICELLFVLYVKKQVG